MNDYLNLASFTPLTEALGPGKRAAVWVQSCPFHCPGCIVPEWQESKINALIPIRTLAEWILSSPGINGITISGGEPMAQAEVLSSLLTELKQYRDLDVICFSGYTIEQLIKNIPAQPAIGQLLDQVDVLIDSPYIKKLDDNRGLRGSSNQRIHHLTHRLSFFDFENTPRSAELQFFNGEMLLAGVPPYGILTAFNEIKKQINRSLMPVEV
jgi:anaerobic ribonucleoside-triphosphate reductase activating protein